VCIKEAGGLGLRAGEAARDDLRVAAGCVFVNIDRADFEWQAEPGEQIAAPG
jgi:hypothetical protein